MDTLLRSNPPSTTVFPRRSMITMFNPNCSSPRPHQTAVSGRLTCNVGIRVASLAWPCLESSMAGPAIKMMRLLDVRDTACYVDDPSCNKQGFEVGESRFGRCKGWQQG